MVGVYRFTTGADRHIIDQTAGLRRLPSLSLSPLFIFPPGLSARNSAAHAIPSNRLGRGLAVSVSRHPCTRGYNNRPATTGSHTPRTLWSAPRMLVMALTLLRSASAQGLRYPLALSQGEHGRRLGLDHLLSRSRAGPVAPPRFDSPQFGFRLFLRSQHSAPPIFE